MTPDVPIIAIGSSADGIRVLPQLVAALPANLPAAVIIVQHVSSSRPSLLPKLLGRVSNLPVKTAADGEILSAGTIYVAAPGFHLSVANGTARVAYGPKVTYARPSIDVLMTSLARVSGKRSIGVILGGANSDGAIGLAEIRNAGGETIVQDPAEAKYSFMPERALALDGHRILPLAAIPLELTRLAEQFAGSGAMLSE